MNTKNSHLYIVIILLLLLGCAFQKSIVEQKGDALILLTNLTKESKSKKFALNEEKIAQVVTEMDSLLENEIVVSKVSDIEKLQEKIEKTSQLDSMLLKHAKETKNNRLAISLRELKFRTLVKTQERMEEAFENEEDAYTLETEQEDKYPVGEVHGKWVFKQRVSMMLPYMQGNEKFSETKTILLTEMIDLLPQIQNKDEKRRCWLAIDRMLDEIDVQKSESGYRPFQRSPQGIFTRSGQIIEKLKSQQTKEADPEIRDFSASVIIKLEKNLNEKKDGNFWKKVEFSKELTKKFESERNKTEDFSKIPITEGPTASEWFDKGYAAPDENLKIEYFTKAIELDSQYAAAYNNRGNAYQALGQNDKALDDFNKAIELNTEFEPAYINRGNIYQQMGKNEEAIQDFSRAIVLETKYTLAYNNRGMSFKELGRYEKALQDFNKAIELNPRYASAYINRGDVYRKLGKDSDAIQDYTRAIDLDPKYAVAYNNRGLSYNNLGKHQQAIRDYQKVIEISSDYAAAYYNLGIVYWILKKWNEVVKAWEKCLELDPTNQYVQEYLPKAKRQARKLR